MDSLINLIYAIRNIFVSFIYNAYWAIRQRVALNFQIPKRKKKSVTLTPQIKKLKSKLITLLHGDRDTAKRLIKQQNQMNRGRSYQWCLEKVIYDIERDRKF